LLILQGGCKFSRWRYYPTGVAWFYSQQLPHGQQRKDRRHPFARNIGGGNTVCSEQNIEEFLERNIEKLERDLRAARAALAAHRRANKRANIDRSTDATKYVDMRPIDVFKPCLEQEQALRTATELIRELEKGGNTKGKKSGTGMIAIKKSLNSGALVLFENGKAVSKSRVGAKIKPMKDPDKMVIGLPGRKYGTDGRVLLHLQMRSSQNRTNRYTSLQRSEVP
jgi:hypothetical protein